MGRLRKDWGRRGSWGEKKTGEAEITDFGCWEKQDEEINGTNLTHDIGRGDEERQGEKRNLLRKRLRYLISEAGRDEMKK